MTLAEPVTVAFDLAPDDVRGLLDTPGQRNRGYLNIGILVILDVLCFAALHLDNLGIFLVALTIIAAFSVAYMPKVRDRHAERLGGATKVEFSERGIVYSGVNVAERLEWSRVATLADRPRMWVILTRPSRGIYLVPKSAVPAEHAEQFVDQLMTWSGKAYKFRKR